jgi:hypothetical protein
MENKKHQKEKKISSLITFIIQSLICCKIFFTNASDNNEDLKILILVSLALGFLLIISRNQRFKSIGKGILFGSFTTAMIFAILFFFSIFFFYSKHSVC